MFSSNLGPRDFFLWVLPLLDVTIVTSYHFMQFQEKLEIQTQENAKNPHFEPDLGPLGTNSQKGFHEFYPD